VPATEPLLLVLGTTGGCMRPGQSIGLGVLITVGAIVGGYLVYLLVPKKHFRIVAGILAANAIIAAMALAGLDVAEALVGWFAFFSFLVGVAALQAVIDY
jgi:hypothetical protein